MNLFKWILYVGWCVAAIYCAFTGQWLAAVSSYVLALSMLAGRKAAA